MRVALALLLLAGCTTANAARTGASRPRVPGPVTVVPSRLDPTSAIDRVLGRATFGGFALEVANYLEPGEAQVSMPLGSRSAARGTLDLDAREAEVVAAKNDPEACWGESEVLQARALLIASGSELHLSCHTERLQFRDRACVRQIESGCPKRGDRLVGEIALDVSSF